MHRHTLAFLEVWHTFQWAQENNRGLAEVGDKTEGREWQRHNSQNNLQTLSSAQRLRQAAIKVQIHLEQKTHL